MKSKQKIMLGAIAVVLAIVLVGWMFRVTIGTALLQQVAHQNIGRNIIPTLPDGLHLALCGTGSPFPDPTRAGPCSAIIAGDRLFIARIIQSLRRRRFSQMRPS